MFARFNSRAQCRLQFLTPPQNTFQSQGCLSKQTGLVQHCVARLWRLNLAIDFRSNIPPPQHPVRKQRDLSNPQLSPKLAQSRTGKHRRGVPTSSHTRISRRSSRSSASSSEYQGPKPLQKAWKPHTNQCYWQVRDGHLSIWESDKKLVCEVVCGLGVLSIDVRGV